MLENVREVEAHLRTRLSEVQQVVRLRGRGLLLGLEFRDKAAPIHKALLDRNIITGTSSDPSVLRLLPPLCLKVGEIDLFVNELKAIIADENQSQGGMI
jgi:acetylornithine/N-succinyldiaminopimelate aminotransferase